MQTVISLMSAESYENACPLNLMKMPTRVLYLLAEKISRSDMFSKKEFAVTDNMRFISMKNLILSRVEHKNVL